jgi:hypothetical protein
MSDCLGLPHGEVTGTQSTPDVRAVARRIVERIASETLDYRGRVRFASEEAKWIVMQELVGSGLVRVAE